MVGLLKTINSFINVSTCMYITIKWEILMKINFGESPLQQNFDKFLDTTYSYCNCMTDS